MTLSDIDKNLLLCQKHLEDTNSKGSEVESFLTQFLLIHICGEYEKEIEKIVGQRAKKSSDVELATFVSETIEAYKHLKLEAIRGKILRKFSEKYVNHFDSKIKGSDSEIMYQNIITNRDSIAHGGNINMTLAELINSHDKAKLVLAALYDSLNL